MSLYKANRIPRGRAIALPFMQMFALPLSAARFTPAALAAEANAMTRISLRAAVTAVACLLAVAPAASADAVTPDDSIVQGSQCIGTDCADGELFDLDTLLKLKSGTPRLKFEDTSTGLFPGTDWQLVAGDSSSGGQNFFRLTDATAGTSPFTVLGNAPTNSLFVSNTGKVGVGTDNPALLMSLRNTDTPAVRFEQTNGGGFTPQTWDIGANEANFFVRDLTAGSKLSFRIRPGAPTSSLDIQANGDVSTERVVQQKVDNTTDRAAVDPQGVLAKVVALPLQTYRYNGDPTNARHLAPLGTDFRTAFGLGGTDVAVAPGDMSGVALVAIKALNTRIDQLQLAKGDQGPQGPEGQRGSDGLPGAAGPAGGIDSKTAAQIKALLAANTKQDKRIKALEKKLKALARARR